VHAVFVARALPTGTVTFLFTDAEGSTRLLAELGAESYADALAAHREALRQAVERHAGVEVDAQGDSFFAAFPDAGEAVAAAADGQRALAGGRFKVRMAVHSGEPVLTEDGYIGLAVHRAARICAAAHGGQVLVSERTRALLDDGEELVDLGLHRLADLGEPQRLFQLGGADHPLLRSLNATNLPAQPNELMGRERELGELGALVAATRLVTLTGAGGSGKTRLALQVAAEAVRRFPDGVYWAPLAELTEPALVLPTIGTQLGARGPLSEHIDERHVLLLLDNVEHLLGAAPEMSKLLRRCPRLHLLVTSRELLRIEGEHEYPVEPLPSDAAVRLFREQAASAEPEDAVLEICRRVDCLPLAVELAAARTTLLPPAALLARLDERLPLLTAGRRDAPQRQRTLHATIAWSHELLSLAEQEGFRRVAVFAGSFDPAAAEELGCADLDVLQSLLDKSLVHSPAPGRLAMLATIREFAFGELESAGEAQVLRRRHAERLLALAESANLHAEAAGPQHHELLNHEDGNLRAALEWALLSGELELGVRLAVALEEFWVTRNPFEGMRWFGMLLRRGEQLSPRLRARALLAWGGSLFIVGRFDEAVARFEESLELYRELGDERGVGLVLQRLSEHAQWRGDLDAARSLTEESRVLLERAGFPKGELFNLGTLGRIAIDAGDHDRGLELMAESTALAVQLGYDWWEAWNLGELAEQCFLLERWDEAGHWARPALRAAHAIGERQLLVYGLALAAVLSARAGDSERAGAMWGALETEEARGPVGQWEGEREAYARHVLVAADPDFDRGRAIGRAFSLDEAVEHALSET
jgi:predicted ATPase/class 3 adenylate cyclase